MKNIKPPYLSSSFVTPLCPPKPEEKKKTLYPNKSQPIAMHDSIVIPACFSSGERPAGDESASAAGAARSGQSVFMSVYRTKIAGQSRLITVTWCKNLLLRGLSVSIHGHEESDECQYKVELKPWYFWRKQGDKQFVVDGKPVSVAWDLKAARFGGETEPQSDYYVAVVCDDEVVLLVGDMKKDAFRKTGCPPSLTDPVLVSRKEHLFGKRRFLTRVKFHHERAARFHEILIECNNMAGFEPNGVVGSGSGSGWDPELEVRFDGKLALHVKHLQWKFRGNECVELSKSTRVEVLWDVHDWLFSSGTRHGMFIFSPVSSSKEAKNHDHHHDDRDRDDDHIVGGSSRFSLFVYAWKVE